MAEDRVLAAAAVTSGKAPTLAVVTTPAAATTAAAKTPAAVVQSVVVQSAPAASTPAAAAPAAEAAVAPAMAVTGEPLTPLSGSGDGLPLQSPAPWAALAVARRFGRFDARTMAAGTRAVPAAAATTGTTTKITWAWGTNPVLAFNPANDKLDFSWMQPSAFTVTEAAGSTRISIVDNNHSYTLQNVPISALTMSNIVAKDAGTISKWQNLLSAQPVTSPTVSIGNTTAVEGNSSTTNATFAVTLSKASSTPITVGYQTGDGTATAGSDYTATAGTLTFNPGVTTQQVVVKVIGDTTVEPDEAFSVTLSNPNGAVLGARTGTATIKNDDAPAVTPPTVSITNSSVTEGNSGTKTMTFAVSLSKASDKAVTVAYSTANGTAVAGQDYAAASGTLTFAAGSTAQQVNVTVNGDNAVEANETITVTLANPSGATLATATATGTIIDDDTANPPPATADRWGTTFYAPYVDMGGWPVPDLLAISQSNGGGSLFTAAFMQATPDGKLAWAGLNALEPGADNDQARAINQSIKDLQDAGGDVMISLGGAAGTSLAQWGAARGMTATQLADAYAEVIDTYGVTHLDFDIEGAAVAEQASIALHSQALKLLQQSKPEVQIWYTLPVLPSGLTADGLRVVDTALNAGVTLAGVNVMAMDYGESAAPTSGPNAKSMGAYAIDSAESTYNQLTTLYGTHGQTFSYSQLGVTPMLGVNDITTEVFTLADAQLVEDYARTKGIGMLALWSVTRDTPGQLGVSTYTHSGMSAPAGSFAKIFNDYGTVNVLDYSAAGGGTGTPGTGGGTGTPGTGGGTGTPVTGGSTTKVTWNWGTNTALSFDPAKDKLDFVWMGPAYFDITEKSGSTVISIRDNNQTYTLTGVALSQLQMGNIVALDSGTVSKWKSAISAAASVL
ncbi:MAG: hypothetical protein KDB50_07125 [Mycobacterium sp.]|nr:hypothetical protein [Mycobacterium sp.]